MAIKYDPSNSDTLQMLKKAVQLAGFVPHAFVERGYVQDARQMMEEVLGAVPRYDVLLIEATREAIGIGIEAGVFWQKRKPIISVYKKGVKLSRTLRGISAECVEYKSPVDLEAKLTEALRRVEKRRTPRAC